MKKNLKYVGLVLTAILAIGLTGCAQPEVKYVDRYVDRYVEAIIKDGTYTVYHYQQVVTGGNSFSEYTLKEKQSSKAISAGTTIDGLKKSYGGFTAKALAQNGSAIYVLYDRNKITYTFDAGEGKFSDDSKTKTISGLYGSTYSNPSTVSPASKMFSLWQNSNGNISPLVFGENDDTFSAVYFDIGSLTIYSFHETPVVLPAGTDGTAGTSATYVEFGDWPQTVLSSTSIVSVDESKKIIRGLNTYYLGSDGNYYAKCKENAYASGTEYKYTDGTQPGIGETSTRYFKVEPIKWRVLTDNYSGKKLLLAENILTANVPYYKYNNSSYTRTVGTDTNIYPNNYKYSQIRAYLNGLDYYYDSSSTKTVKKSDYNSKGFLQTAFSSEAQALIADTQVVNNLASTGDSTNSYVCDPTADKIFLLSRKEAFNDVYFADKTNRIRKPTDFAKANYAWQSLTEGEGGYWWLRSPDYSNRYIARRVYSGGSVIDYDVSIVNYTETGVVPALSISF